MSPHPLIDRARDAAGQDVPAPGGIVIASESARPHADPDAGRTEASVELATTLLGVGLGLGLGAWERGARSLDDPDEVAADISLTGDAPTGEHGVVGTDVQVASVAAEPPAMPSRGRPPTKAPREARRTRVALVDDSARMRDTLTRGMLGVAPDLDVVTSVASWIAFESYLDAGAPPDVIVLGELHFDDHREGEWIRRFVDRGIAVVIFAGDATVDRSASMIAGASSTLARTATLSALVRAVRSAHGPRAAREWRAARDPSAALDPGAAHEAPVVGTVSLSTRELDALTMYLDGASVAAVASSMGVGYETAKTFLRRVRRKYADAGRPASTRDELRLLALEDGR